jgi:hypothetical protein
MERLNSFKYDPRSTLTPSKKPKLEGIKIWHWNVNGLARAMEKGKF